MRAEQVIHVLRRGVDALPFALDIRCRSSPDSLTAVISMRYLPEDAAQLRVCLEDQPDDRKVEADPDTRINAKTVKDLRALETWPPGLVVDTPRENYPELTVRIRSKPPPL
jgi:hypothetical protein